MEKETRKLISQERHPFQQTCHRSLNAAFPGGQLDVGRVVWLDSVWFHGLFLTRQGIKVGLKIFGFLQKYTRLHIDVLGQDLSLRETLQLCSEFRSKV